MLFNWFGLDKKIIEERLDIIEQRLGSLLDKNIIENSKKIDELRWEIEVIKDYYKKHIFPLKEFLGYEVITEFKDDPSYLPPSIPKIPVYKLVKKPNKK